MMLQQPPEKDLIENVVFYANGVPEYLTKEDVRDHREELVHRRLADSNLQEASTSGNTGKPLKFFLSEQEQAVIHECYCRPYFYLPQPSYRAITIRHFDKSDAPTDPRTIIALAVQDADQSVSHSFRCLSSKEPCDVLAQMVYEEQPELLEGYISSIYLIARVLLNQGRVMKCVEVISPSGEHIREYYRPFIAEAFPNAKVYDRYGAEELGALAWQCPLCEKYHFNADYYAIKACNGNGEEAKVAITKRYVSAFQLANYDIGDDVKITGMGFCAIELPTIEISGGRSDDILIDKHGEPLPVMPYHFGEIDGLFQWQIIQQSDLSLDVNAIVDKESDRIANMIESHVRESLRGFQLPVRVHFVRNMTTTRKFKRVVSQRGEI